MQDSKSQQRQADMDAKAARLAEELRANLGKRKALARAKKAKAAEAGDDALETPHGAGTGDGDADASS